MPITSDLLNGRADWTFVSGEDVDLSGLSSIKFLYIIANRPVDTATEPYIVPSIAGLFPNLAYLSIKNWGFVDCFIRGLTDLPESLISITLENTYIPDLGIISGLNNLESFTMRYNRVPISMSGPLPCSVRYVTITHSQITDELIFPPEILHITCCDSTIPIIQGLNQAVNDKLECHFSWCATPYDNNVLDIHIPPSRHKKISHITRVNSEMAYTDFGSIPKRIRVSPDNVESPIVVALNLASNYPRRMAEFVVDMSVAFEDNDDAYYEMEVEYEDDDDDPYADY